MIFVQPFGETNVLMILVLWVDTRPLVVVEVFDTTAALEVGFLVGRRVMGLWVLMLVTGNGRRGCWRIVEMLGRVGGMELLLFNALFGYIAGGMEILDD